MLGQIHSPFFRQTIVARRGIHLRAGSILFVISPTRPQECMFSQTAISQEHQFGEKLALPDCEGTQRVCESYWVNVRPR